MHVKQLLVNTTCTACTWFGYNIQEVFASSYRKTKTMWFKSPNCMHSVNSNIYTDLGVFNNMD